MGKINNVRERTILEEGDVKMTNRRAIIGTKTYSLTDVISVRMTKDRTAIGSAIAAFVGVGILLGTFSLDSEVYNSEYCLAWIISLGAAVVVALLAPPSYILQIRSMSRSIFEVDPTPQRIGLSECYASKIRLSPCRD